MNRLTLSDVQKRNASDSDEILIVHQGKVYDVSQSAKWQGGSHMKRHRAGEDLTQAMTVAPHGEEVLEKFPIVADLAEKSAANDYPKGLLGWVLNMHPHPVSVHFPIALIMTSALLTVIGWLYKSDFFITAGFTNLVIGTLATPAAFATGFLSFHFNYQHTWTKTFRMKQILSIFFFIVSLTAILIHSAAPGTIESPGFWQKAYFALILCLPPIVGATGYLGGTITFPRS
jgi:predicted heme/steroid binding protein/uncharacterized membrane protein